MLTTVISILATLLFGGLILLILVIVIYNHLNGLRDHCTNAFGQLELPMNRRSELISQLARKLDKKETGDRAIREAVVGGCQLADATRKRAADDFGDQEEFNRWIDAEQELREALSQLLTLVDAETELQHDAEASDLSSELRSVVGRITFAREAFNEFAELYNGGRDQFPTYLLASKLGFDAMPLFVTAGEQPAES